MDITDATLARKNVSHLLVPGWPRGPPRPWMPHNVKFGLPRAKESTEHEILLPGFRHDRAVAK